MRLPLQVDSKDTVFRLSFGLFKTALFLVSALLFAGLPGCGYSDGETAGKTVFRYNQPEALTSLDPAFARNQANGWATTQLFNGLVELDDSLRTSPALARKWEISDDGLVYTFYLRKDVKFHDSEVFAGGKGRPITAQDFVYSFSRIIDPKTASTGAWIFNDKVLQTPDGKISDTCFVAVNDSTFRVHLQRPFIAFLEIITMPYAYLVPREAVEKYGKDFRSQPVGTGPFRFHLWEEGTALVFHKNPEYWKKDELGNKLPYLDAVQISFIADYKVAFLTFLQGKLDFLSGIKESNRDMILQPDGTVQPEFADKFKLQKVPYLNTEYIGFQLDPEKKTSETNPYHDKRVRQALNYALDKKALILYQRNNIGRPGTSGFVPAALPSFSEEKVPGYNFNPTKARQLLNEAGYGGQKPLQVKLSTVAEHKELAEFMQNQWATVGVKCEIDINQAGAHQEMVDNGRVHFWMKSWLGDYPDAENYLALFYSKNFSPAGPNKTHFSNEEYDRLYEQANLTTDQEKRWEIYHQLDKIIVEECPAIVLFYDEVIRLTQSNIKGLTANPMNMLKLEKVRKE